MKLLVVFALCLAAAGAVPTFGMLWGYPLYPRYPPAYPPAYQVANPPPPPFWNGVQWMVWNGYQWVPQFPNQRLNSLEMQAPGDVPVDDPPAPAPASPQTTSDSGAAAAPSDNARN